jgi:hypothetical protein
VRERLGRDVPCRMMVGRWCLEAMLAPLQETEQRSSYPRPHVRAKADLLDSAIAAKRKCISTTHTS